MLTQYLQLVFRGMPSYEAMRFMKLLPKFVAGDWPDAVGPETASEEDWQLRINEDAVMDFDEVGSSNDYKRSTDIDTTDTEMVRRSVY